ncbi:NAD(P)-dependent oxidoreductase [Vallicoccus soli]|uniref:NAD(P)-dependent oxidoreductase n=1 Tax=Vallicoccus soli TaxID=2339232 RepID=A0A3A3YXM9_9ACTN|nr:NAD(P)-dependent oxidoreductase [Vallicoccus soli]RJK94713.1 NAD(P)-dependent oxidoreductase [Vallicoccus soli]
MTGTHDRPAPTASPGAAVPDRPVVALLGTGTMGAPMARRIAGAGLPLRVWNRTAERARPLADVAEVLDDPAAAVRGADVVVTMLFDADAVLDAVAAAAPAPGTAWLQTSTVGVDGAGRTVALARERGLVLVDAPVLGTRQPAEQGALTALASGPDEARARVRPVLDAVAQRTLWVGPAGAGSRLKLAVNAWVLTTVQGVAESLALAEGLGVEPALVLEALRGGALDSPYVQSKGAAMLGAAFDPAFPLRGAAKDAALLAAAGGAAGLDLRLAPALEAAFARALADGHGDLDMAATYLSARRAP